MQQIAALWPSYFKVCDSEFKDKYVLCKNPVKTISTPSDANMNLGCQ